MRRFLPLAVSALVVLAACSDDESADDTPEMSLETVPPEFVDKCDEDYVPPTAVEDTAVDSTEATDSTEAPGTTNAVETTEAVDTTAAAGTTDASETTDATDGTTAGFRSSSADTTEPTETTEPGATTEASDDTAADGTTEDTATEGTDTEGTDAPETTDDPYGQVPDVELPDELPTELVRTVLEEGSSDGREAVAGDTIQVYYVGVLSETGVQFDANYGSGTPFPVANVGNAQVIDGWNEGLIGARPGDRIQLDIPADLAYGDQERDGIPAGSALTFVIDVVEVDGPPEFELPEEIPTALERTVLEEGQRDGREAKEGDAVEVYLVSANSATGDQFEMSFGAADPQVIAIGQSGVPGLDEGLVGARPGDRIRLDIPIELGYGEQGSPDGLVPPATPLTYIIDIVDVQGPPDYEIPAVAPTELERTVLDEGAADGRVAQNFDTISVNWVVVVGEPNDPEDVTETTEATDGTAADGTEPTADTDDATTEVAETTETADTTEAAATEGAGTTAAETTEGGDTTEAADTTEGADTTETGDTTEGTAADSSAPTESTEPEIESAVGNIVISSYGDVPVEIPVGGEGTGIEGLDEGLPGVKAGDVIQLDIPADMALGAAGSPESGIPEFSSLTIVMEVIEVTGPPLVDRPAEIPTELVVTELAEGTGSPAAEGDTVFVEFVGELTEDGTRVQTNFELQPYPVVLGADDPAVIEGWQQGLIGVTAGSQIQLDVPADLAYGADGSGEDVPPDAALSFLINVVGIAPATAVADAPMDLDLPLTEEPLQEVVTDDVIEGDGPTLHEGQDAVVNVSVVCANTGALIDSSWERDRREVIPTASGSVMEGLRQGILEMRVGGRRIISVPTALAMGEAGSPELGVDANQDLIFVVDLYAILGDDPTATTEVTETTES